MTMGIASRLVTPVRTALVFAVAALGVGCGDDAAPERSVGDAAPAQSDGEVTRNDAGGSADGAAATDAALRDGASNAAASTLASACQRDQDCTDPAFPSCKFSEFWPDGYCTASCPDQDPDDKVCGVDACYLEPALLGGDAFCVRHCDVDSDCRQGQYCLAGGTESENGASTTTNVCMPGVVVRGSVTLRDGVTIAISDEHGGSVTVSASGPFELPKRLLPWQPYTLTVKIQGDSTGLGCRTRELDGLATVEASHAEITCGKGVVQRASNNGKVCTSDDDCAGGDVMSLCNTSFPGGRCESGCGVSEHCGSGEFCEDSICMPFCYEGFTKPCTERPGTFCTEMVSSTIINGTVYANTTCLPGVLVKGTAFLSPGVSVMLSDAAAGSVTLNASGTFSLPNAIPQLTGYNLQVALQGNVQDVACTSPNLTGANLLNDTNVLLNCGRQQTFTEPGTVSWRVPPGVNSVSVVVVGAGGRGTTPYGGGGGELCYLNNIAVTPGATVPVVVGSLRNGNEGAGNSSFNGTLIAHEGASTRTSQNLFLGGTGGTVGTCFQGGHGGHNDSSGGAAGYTGRGGDAAANGNDATASQGGGGGGGYFYIPGGGVGLEGIGANGVARGGNGSQANANVPVVGGGGTMYNSSSQTGMNGGVRIIWGAGRSYPNNAANQ